ncbi:MAG TPA: CHASE domain-containing protein [Anaeromyxobacteraceae bacterium]
MRPRALLAHLRAHAAAYLVLAVGLAATALVRLYVVSAVEAQRRARFEEHAGTAEDAIRNRMEAYVATLRATAGLFTAGTAASRDQFRVFVETLQLDAHYPGIQGVGFAQLVAPSDVALHEQAVRGEGLPGYRVWPESGGPWRSAIVYLEPTDWRNERALGYDMFSEPVRQEAMKRALETRHTTSTSAVVLVQETGRERQPGFLIYQPVFSRSAPEDAERGVVLGFVFAPFRARDLLQATLPADALGHIRLEVYSSGARDPSQLLYASAEPQGAAAGALVRSTAVMVAGRPWTLYFEATPAFTALWERWLPRWVLVAGVLVSLLLFRVTRGEVRGAVEARRAERRASVLADAGRALSASLDYQTTLAEVASRAARDQCDWCVVLLVEPGGPPVRLVGHRDPVAARGTGLALAEVVLDPEGRVGAAAAMESADGSVTESIDEAALRRIARGPEHLERLRAAGLRSLASVPLRARGETLGAITFASCSSSHRFEAADLALLRDLARLVAAAIDTARLYRRAQEAIRVRDEFLSIASHELKTPLTSLALQADSLRAAAARGRVPEPIAQKAEVIRRNVDRLTRLITNLLDISRIGAGRLELELEELDLSELVREVVVRFEDELERAGCELRLDAQAPAVGRWDRLRLDQVVTNLIGNAVKYGPGKPVEVTVRTEGERTLLRVRDHGIGIPREAQSRIFERFERAVSDRHYGGFGLGLWIVRLIVDALGGTIAVESELGQGATFTVELGRMPSAVGPAAAVGASGAAS